MPLFILTLLELSFVHGDIHIDYHPTKIPLGSWLDLPHLQTVEECVIDCGEKCNEEYDRDGSCNSFIFDESNDVCTRALYVAGAAEDTGLRVAWASSQFEDRSASLLIDRNTIGHQHFLSDKTDTLPWVAIDLVTEHKVTKVDLVERKITDFRLAYLRATNIEIRVGNDKPYKYGTRGSSLYRNNKVCGLFEGPAKPGGTSSVPCTAPLTGRYITIQKIVPGDAATDTITINWAEVIIESSPVSTTGGEKIEILLREPTEDSPAPGQCTSDYPFAFKNGDKCCSTGSENNSDPAWVDKWSFGFLNYASKTCGGKSIICGAPPCLNHEFKVDYNYYFEPDKLELSFAKLTAKFCSVELT